MAELAGRVGDGMNAPAGPDLAELINIGRDAHTRAGRRQEDFLVTASGQPSARECDRLARLGVSRLIVFVRAPYVDSIRRAKEALGRER